MVQYRRQSVFVMAVSRGMGLLCVCMWGGVGDSEVVEGEEEVSSAFWQQLHAYMENRFASSQISVAGGASYSLSSNTTHPPPHTHTSSPLF